jgi:hypothetical protein
VSSSAWQRVRGYRYASGRTLPGWISVSASPPDVAGEVQLSSYQLPITYAAVAGDTWASIATAFGLKEASLRAFQGRAISTEPAAGTLVDLRGRDYPRPGASGGYEKGPSGQPDTHIVQSGGSPDAVAARFGIPVRELVTDNQLPGRWSLSPEDSASFLPK